jgi:threonine/homoserine/homoserine lactone efflux protein
LLALKLACGLYVVLLGFRAGRAALKPGADRVESAPTTPRAKLFRQGLLNTSRIPRPSSAGRRS